MAAQAGLQCRYRHQYQTPDFRDVRYLQVHYGQYADFADAALFQRFYFRTGKLGRRNQPGLRYPHAVHHPAKRQGAFLPDRKPEHFAEQELAGGHLRCHDRLQRKPAEESR